MGNESDGRRIRKGCVLNDDLRKVDIQFFTLVV